MGAASGSWGETLRASVSLAAPSLGPRRRSTVLPTVLQPASSTASHAAMIPAAADSLIPGLIPLMGGDLIHHGNGAEGATNPRKLPQLETNKSQGIRAQKSQDSDLRNWVQKQERRSFAAPPPCAMSSLSPVRDDQSAIAETFRSLDHAL